MFVSEHGGGHISLLAKIYCCAILIVYAKLKTKQKGTNWSNDIFNVTSSSSVFQKCGH